MLSQSYIDFALQYKIEVFTFPPADFMPAMASPGASRPPEGGHLRDLVMGEHPTTALFQQSLRAPSRPALCQGCLHPAEVGFGFGVGHSSSVPEGSFFVHLCALTFLVRRSVCRSVIVGLSWRSGGRALPGPRALSFE